MSKQTEASAPLKQQRRGNRFVEFVFIFTICFAITSLVKFEPLARNTVQNHNGQFDLPPRSNHSVGMQSGMDLSSSHINAAIVEDLKMSLLQDEYNVRNFSDGAVIVSQESDHQDDADNYSESDSESCLRPRRNSDEAVKAPLKLPCKSINLLYSFGVMAMIVPAPLFRNKRHTNIIMQSSQFYSSHTLVINLGMPKMGSTSLHTYFQCGGYESIHWACGKKLYCADCIKRAIQAGLPPFSKCNINNTVASYAQIDRGPENLPQVSYLSEIVGGVSNATFILTFRNMTKWYMSLTNWQSKKNPEVNMRSRFQRANLTGLPTGVGRNVSEFSHFYCEYVKRVREEVAKYPGRHELVEIDIEDPKVGWQLEEVFGVNRTCWGKKNGAVHNDTVSEEELQR